MIIPEKILEALHEVHSYAGNIDSWIVIKKEILKNLHPNDRRVFSTRDPLTKKQRINEFEIELAKQWEATTGCRVVFNDHEKTERSSTSA